jgi:hypothetical protein
MRSLISNTRSRPLAGRKPTSGTASPACLAVTIRGPLEPPIAPRGHSSSAAAGLGSYLSSTWGRADQQASHDSKLSLGRFVLLGKVFATQRWGCRSHDRSYGRDAVTCFGPANEVRKRSLLVEAHPSKARFSCQSSSPHTRTHAPANHARYFAIFQSNRLGANPATTNGSHLATSTERATGDEIDPMAEILECDKHRVCTPVYTSKEGSL